MFKFGTKMPYLVILGLKFENNIVIFEISTFEFVFSAKFCEKTKMPKFGTKNALFGYFWAGIFLEKAIVIFLNQNPRIFLIAKFCKETKIP